ncbi:MAG TPA: GTPase Era [Magnetospirillaceae bacterium]|jgi:GTP-binding protein Era
MSDTDALQRCGLVAVVGPPNVGKSTLVNRLVGSKVSIVSPKVQTTRTRVMGIALVDATQIVFVDTPGIFAPKRRLERAMVRAAWDGAGDADEIIFVVDALKGIDDVSRAVADKMRAAGQKPITVINKIDAVKRETLLGVAAQIAALGFDEQVFMVSAIGGDGVRDLLPVLASRLPEGPWLFPDDQVSDMSERLWAAEITREQVFLQLHDELPHSTAVTTESWTEQGDGSLRVDQVVYVQRDGQKAIVLGAGGRRIKEIGSRARVELEKHLERRVHLFLQVKVDPRWPDDRGQFSSIGLDYDS